MGRTAYRDSRGSGIIFLIFCLAVFLFMGSPGLVADAQENEGEAQTLSDAVPSLGGIRVTQGGGNLVLVQVDGNRLPVPDILSVDAGHLTFLWKDVYLPSGFWEREYHVPLLKKIQLTQEPEGVRMAVFTNAPLVLRKLRGAAPASNMVLYLGKEQETTDRIEIVEAPVSRKAGDPLASGTPVTLELRDTDLRDVFRMLGGVMNMNVIVDPSVPPSPVTLSLQEVPMNEAFGYLMRMYEVTYAIMGKTLIVGKEDSLARTTGMEKTRAFHIAYAETEQIPALLEGIAGVSRVVMDERLRTVYVTASESQLVEVERTLEKIDHPGRQVMLQARILEVSDTATKSLETLIQGVYKQWWFTYSAAGGTAGYLYDNDPANIDDYDPEEGTSETSKLGMDLANVSGNALKMLDAGLSALVSDSKAKLLASPSVVTIEGQKATIKLVEDIKYISGRDDAGNPVYGDVEAGPVLEFTPTIGRSEIVNLEMNIKTGDVTLTTVGTYQYPESNTREVETTVRVRDGEPFVVGGLFYENISESKWKVPVISEIPLLGELFKGSNKTAINTQVVMIVVPYILSVPEGPIESFELVSE
ncbi:MAG: secretion protein [Synergistota bacterium]|nr:secretion protein [Synergistota bacterium]